VSTTNYYIEIFADPTDARVPELQDAVHREISRLGIHRTVSVKLLNAPVKNDLAAAVYFGTTEIAQDDLVTALVSRSLEKSRVIIPVVNDLTTYMSSVPECLRPLNAFAWLGQQSAEVLCRKLLEELGIEDRQRRVFISHKRDDGLAAAEQLHEHLSRNGFLPFIDRFHIPSGSDVQAEIADQLEDCAMLLLLETPLAHTSDWVFDEVDYALSHIMGMHIVSWPDTETELPGTHGLPRQLLAKSDLRSQKGYDIFTSATIDRLIAEVEAEHARAMVQRRKYLLVSAEEAAQDAGRECIPLPGWRMVVQSQSGSSIVQVTPRLPAVDDLYALDNVREDFPGAPSGILIHAARRLRDSRRNLLLWAGKSRDLTLVPENAIGSYWRSDVA
jgi:hypothetical protein